MQGPPLSESMGSTSSQLVQYPFYTKQPTEKMFRLFNKYKEIFLKRLGESLVSVKQMGSGAIPGMAGSAMIDILMVVKNYPLTAEQMKTLQDLNMSLMFRGKGPQGPDDTWMRSFDFPPDGDFAEFKVDGSFPPEGHLGRITVHIVHYSCPWVVKYLAYVEYLKANEDAFRRYRDVKIQKAKMGADQNVQGGSTFHKYKHHKSAVVLELMDEALAWKEKNGIKFPEEQIML